jgi:hypothetical protein
MKYEDFNLSPEQIAKNKREYNILETAYKYGISAADIARAYAAPWRVEDDIDELKEHAIIHACDNYGLDADDLERLYRDSCDGCCEDCEDCPCHRCDHYNEQHHQHPQQPVTKEMPGEDHPIITSGAFGNYPALPDTLKKHYMKEFENNKKSAEVVGKVTQSLTTVVLDYITEAGCYRSNNTLKSMCEIIDD